MKLLLKIGIILCTGMMVQNAQGQSHNTNCPQCAYSKNKVKDPTKIGTADESCGCTACGEKKKKEKTAKQAEKKKRQDLLASKHKAEKEAKQKAFLAEQKRKQEEASKPKSGEVVINAQPKSMVTSKPDRKKSADTNGKFLRGADYKLYNENLEEIQRPADGDARIISRTFGTFRIDGKSIARYLHPAEIGVIQYQATSISKTCNGFHLNNWDIIDNHWQTLFNDETVNYIEHFYENWFLVGYLPCEEYKSKYTNTFHKSVKLYNVSTQKFHEIKIDAPFFLIEITPTKGLHHNGDGMSVFHNKHYLSGAYNHEDVTTTYVWGKSVKHGAFELLLDDKSGGREFWKAGFIMYVRNSESNPNKGYYIGYIMDENNKFKSFAISGDERNNYYHKPPE